MVSVTSTADKVRPSRPTPGALARLLDVGDADLRALLVGAALKLPDLNGLLIAADRAAEAELPHVERALRLMHSTASGPLAPCEGFAGRTLMKLLLRAEFRTARAAVAGVVLGLLDGTFGEWHHYEAAAVLFAGAGVAGSSSRRWEACYGRSPCWRAAALVARDMMRADDPALLFRVALRCARWSAHLSEDGRCVAAMRRCVNTFVGAVRRASNVSLDDLRELRSGRRRPGR